ncbi:hypothetical protein B5P43_07275 [Bacillus sp. SRB_336]|nr:hypothetical protein B5P43_07275 [Bacillus sp. SRB_336]
MRLEPPRSAPPPTPPPSGGAPAPPGGSLAAGVGLAWLVMVVGELLVMLTGSLGAILGGIGLPPLAVIVWAFVLLGQGKSRTGKGMFLGLLSVIAVVLLLVAACFGLMSNFH